MAILLLLGAAVVGVHAALAAVARARGHGPAAVLGLGAVQGAVFVALVFGGVALMFNGYVEDAGMEPSRTLHIAIPLLAAGVAGTAAAWAQALRRP